MATATATPAAQKVGKVVQIIGPVVDVEFEGGHLPEIYSAVRIVSEPGDTETVDVVAEVEQHVLVAGAFGPDGLQEDAIELVHGPYQRGVSLSLVTRSSSNHTSSRESSRT